MSKLEKNLVAFCGLYCGDCHSYKGEIADYARDLRKKLREAKFAKVAPGLSKYFKTFQNYDVCYEVLGSMVKLRCKRACHNGGGNPSCKIRNCCQKNEYEGCWQCVEFEDCKKLEFLIPIHGDAHLKNLRKISKKGIKAFLEGKRHW